MKNKLFGAALAFSALAAVMTGPAQAADVGVSINIGQPGFYGRIDLGNAPRPQLYYAEPVWVERTVVRPEPIYLRVPPGHERRWSQYCGAYRACGQPVYFVRDDWYRNTYVPHYRDYHDDRGWRDERREDRRDDRRDDRDDDRGKGHGNGHGKGHDKEKHKDKGRD